MTVHPTREEVARTLCRSGRFETGQGGCALLCMEMLGSSRNRIGGCAHADRVHGKLADEILALFTPAAESAGLRGAGESIEGCAVVELIDGTPVWPTAQAYRSDDGAYYSGYAEGRGKGWWRRDGSPCAGNPYGAVRPRAALAATEASPPSAGGTPHPTDRETTDGV